MMLPCSLLCGWRVYAQFLEFEFELEFEIEIELGYSTCHANWKVRIYELDPDPLNQLWLWQL